MVVTDAVPEVTEPTDRIPHSDTRSGVVQWGARSVSDSRSFTKLDLTEGLPCGRLSHMTRPERFSLEGWRILMVDATDGRFGAGLRVAGGR